MSIGSVLFDGRQRRADASAAANASANRAPSLKRLESPLPMIKSFVFFLQTMDFVEASILIPGVLGVSVFLLPSLRNRLGLAVSPELSAGFAEVFGTIALFFVFIAATSLTTVQSYQKDGAQAVDKELAQIASLDHDLTRLSEQEAQTARSALHTYVQLIVDDEWELLKHGEPSEEVDGALENLMGAINKLTVHGEKQDALFSGIVDRADKVAEARDDRIEVANERLSDVYWGMILAIIAAMVVVSFFTQHTLDKRAATCGKMMAIAFTLVMLVQTDGVFSGDVAIKPAGYSKLLKKMGTGAQTAG
jgi:hypothetical protein